MPRLATQKISDSQKEFLEKKSNDTGESISSIVRFCINFSMEVEAMKKTKSYPEGVD